jgi:hypothetical protein
VEVRLPKESRFPKWIDSLPTEHRPTVIAMFKELQLLVEHPTEPTATLTQVAQARRHKIWRLKHSHVDDYAYRFIVWFPPTEPDVAYILFAGNKTGIHDVFYDRAVKESESTLDNLLR